MKLWILDPRLTAERRRWWEGWARHSRHMILAFTLPDAPGLWAGATARAAPARARQLARRIRRHLTGSAVRDPSRQPAGRPDLILLTDGLDGAALMEEIGDLLAGVPLWIYWHTSALASPEPAAPDEIAIELRTARIVHRCVFHGESQRRQFLSALARYDRELALRTGDRAAVLPPGFEPFPPPSEAHRLREPLIVWLLRGEPGELPRLIAAVEHPALLPQRFRLLLLSEHPETEAARARRLPPSIRARILGILSPEAPEARRWAAAARAVVEGSARAHSPIHLSRLAFEGPWPLVPAGSPLGEAIPEPLRPRCTWEDPEDLAEQLAALLRDPPPDPQAIRRALTAWTWPQLAPRYDELCATAPAPAPPAG